MFCRWRFLVYFFDISLMRILYIDFLNPGLNAANIKSNINSIIGILGFTFLVCVDFNG